MSDLNRVRKMVLVVVLAGCGSSNSESPKVELSDQRNVHNENKNGNDPNAPGFVDGLKLSKPYVTQLAKVPPVDPYKLMHDESEFPKLDHDWSLPVDTTKLTQNEMGKYRFLGGLILYEDNENRIKEAWPGPDSVRIRWQEQFQIGYDKWNRHGPEIQIAPENGDMTITEWEYGSQTGRKMHFTNDGKLTRASFMLYDMPLRKRTWDDKGNLTHKVRIEYEAGSGREIVEYEAGE